MSTEAFEDSHETLEHSIACQYWGVKFTTQFLLFSLLMLFSAVFNKVRLEPLFSSLHLFYILVHHITGM